ncbi:TPA: hypothetical protein ACJ2WV_004529 [Kluyvera georgiana]
MIKRKLSVTSGQKFNRLTVVDPCVRKNGDIYHFCRCECGVERLFLARNIESGKSKSCGCLSREMAKERATHGLSKSPVYMTWSRMCRRCDNKKVARYKNYGGRGIKVCERWKNFESFYKDMGDIPGPDFSIGRIDNDKDYCPENCRWETAEQQQNNTSRTIWIEHDGLRMSLTQWAKKLNQPYSLLKNRHAAGWSTEEILSDRKDQRKFITFQGETKLTTEWMRDLGIPISSFYHHARKGLTKEEIIALYAGSAREAKS